MSTTCIHLDADAADHPECTGCQFLLRQLFVQRVETEQEIHQAAARGEPRQDVERRLVERQLAGLTPRGYRLEHGVEQVDAGELAQGWIAAPDMRMRMGHLIAGHRAERLIIDDPAPRSPQPLLDRDPTPEDLEAELEAPRPGVWAGEDGADLRALTQDETDQLIRAELFASASPAEVSDVLAAIGGSVSVPPWPEEGPIRPFRSARCQRGGIDSDPLVRVLARRAWGDRDRQWFELRGVRKGEDVAYVPGYLTAEGVSAIAKSWHQTSWQCGTALDDARPGEQVNVEWSIAGPGGRRGHHYRVSDRLRDPPAPEAYDRINRANLPAFVFDDAVRDPAATARFAEHMASMLAPSAEALAEAERLLDQLRWSDGTPVAPGQRVHANGIDYVVRAIDASPAAVRAETLVARALRRLYQPRAKAKAKAKEDAVPIAKSPPPVPRWAKKRRERSQPRGGR